MRFYGCFKNGVNTIYYPGCQRLFMGGFRGFGQVFWPLAWLRPMADTEAASRTREKNTLAQSNLHVYIRTEWRKLLDCMRMLCRPAFYPYKPLQFCKHAKSFQHPWNVSLFKNSAQLSSPVSFTALIIWIEIRSSEVRLFHQRLNILFFYDGRWSFTVHALRFRFHSSTLSTFITVCFLINDTFKDISL